MTHPALVAFFLYVACRAIELVLEQQSLAALIGQAIVVEWGASKVSVHWSPPNEPMPIAKLARRIAVGLAVGLALAAAVFGTLVASRSVLVDSVRQVQVSVLAIGLLTAGVAAWRDELMLHGLVLRALDGRPALLRVLACGVTSAGAALGRSDASARSVVVAAMLGCLFGTLWLYDRGAWRPWAAHAIFRFSITTLLSGGVVHSRLADNSWGGGSGGMLGGGAAALALAPFAALAVITALQAERTSSPQSGPVG